MSAQMTLFPLTPIPPKRLGRPPRPTREVECACGCGLVFSTPELDGPVYNRRCKMDIENGRKCRTCGQVKDVSEYGIMPTGGRRKKCIQCQEEAEEALGGGRIPDSWLGRMRRLDSVEIIFLEERYGGESTCWRCKYEVFCRQRVANGGMVACEQLLGSRTEVLAPDPETEEEEEKEEDHG